MPGYDQQHADRKSNGSELGSEIRIYAILDIIDKRLFTIEQSTKTIDRLDEKLTNVVRIIEDHSSRIRDLELNITEYKTRGSHVSANVTDVKEEFKHIRSELNSLKASQKTDSAIRKIVSAIVYWVGGIIAGYILFKINAS